MDYTFIRRHLVKCSEKAAGAGSVEIKVKNNIIIIITMLCMNRISTTLICYFSNLPKRTIGSTSVSRDVNVDPVYETQNACRIYGGCY